MKEKGEVDEDAGVTVPPPFSVIVTLVALPPKVLPLTVTAVTPHVLPDVAESATSGGLTHPQLTENVVPVVVQRDALRTVMVWLPLTTLLKVGLCLVGAGIKTVFIAGARRARDSHHCLVEAKGAVDCLYRCCRHRKRSIDCHRTGSC